MIFGMEDFPVSADALRRALAGPDLPARRGYLVMIDGSPTTLWEPGDEPSGADDECGCEP